MKHRHIHVGAGSLERSKAFYNALAGNSGLAGKVASCIVEDEGQLDLRKASEDTIGSCKE